MKYLKLFPNQESALGEVQTPVVFYLNGAPKPMFAGKEWGDSCTIVIDDTEGSAGIKPKGFTIIFRDDAGNIISEKEYISGETIIIPEAPVKEGYTFLGWGDVVIDKAVTNMTFIAQYEVTPKVTITMNDSYTDGSSIALNATKTETVTGELSFTTDLASGIAHIEDNVLIFDKHYEGTINILASALDKHSNIQSDSKTITVSCDVADTVKCVVSNVTADDVEADATSAIIKYDCNVTTTTHAGVSNTVVAHKEKTVTFEANESEEDVTRNGSFTCEHGETVEWSVVQHGKESTPPSDNEIYYKTNDGAVIVPQNMKPTTNTYTNKGVMTFANNVTSIAFSAFMSKSTLTEFYGGMSLEAVYAYAFYSCSRLTSVNLPNCTLVYGSAFAYCTSLTSVNLPSCTSVGGNAFRGCTSLTSIDLPNCSTVDTYAFQNCSSLTSVNLPSCTSVGYNAFQSCSSLTSIDLPKCTSVGVNAFQGCSSLSSVNLPNCSTVTNQAFQNCSSLTSIDLPNCTTVGDRAFTYCPSLSKFTGLLATEDNRCLMSNGTIYAFAPSGLTSYTREDCTSVGIYVFASCSKLTSVNLPNCTTVGNGAFQSCSSLSSVNLPNCTSVGVNAFQGCTSLTSIDLLNCTYVSYSAFQDCSSLTSVNLPNCTSVGGNAFQGCSSLSSVNLPNCSTVGNRAFSDCTSLSSVNLPNCTSVGYYAFFQCYSLTTVILGASTMCSLGNSYAFSYCTSLTSIYVTASLVDTYKADSVWSWYSSKIYPIA